MKVVVRSSSLLFILVNIVLGLPIQRRSTVRTSSTPLPAGDSDKIPMEAVRS